MPKEAKKKKREPKKEESFPHIEGDFTLVSCDLSMFCPGFALLRQNADTRSASLIKMDTVDNGGAKNSKKAHGKILNEIGSKLSDLLSGNDIRVAVRERAFTKFNAATQTIHKVVGVSEMIVWHILESKFQELTPTEVKMQITGYGLATKEEVAEAIRNYIPDPIEFSTDDESDAIAVGIAWLIVNGYMDCIPLEKYKDKVQTKNKETSSDV